MKQTGDIHVRTSSTIQKKSVNKFYILHVTLFCMVTFYAKININCIFKSEAFCMVKC